MSIWCVASAEALYRSDFFPGLGWMLTKDLWQELSPKWPKAYPLLEFFSHIYLNSANFLFS
jgi:alpha-1,3-mannosyl-glycoprotein beta-1,2-N-acetylglucosaminyltransferase